MGFVIARRTALAAAEGNAHSLALDLADQHAALAATGTVAVHAAHAGRGRAARRARIASPPRVGPPHASRAIAATAIGSSRQ